MPWLTGNETAPLTGRCLLIPDDEQFIAAVRGALLDLTYERNWQAFGNTTPAQAAQAALNMLMSMTEWEQAPVYEIGSIQMAMRETTPAGWLLMDGANYAMDDYPELMGVYPASLKNMPSVGRFTVPSMVNRMPVGAGGTYGLSVAGGAATHTLTVNEMPAHEHSILSADTSRALAGTDGGSGIPVSYVVGTGNVSPADIFVAWVTGGSAAHNNMPPYRGVNFYLVARNEQE